MRKLIHSPYILLLGIITITFLYSYGRYIWGGDNFIFIDAASDCADEYYPTYVYIVNQIRDGQLTLWNNSVGLGYDTLTRQERLMDPFAILIIGVGVILGEQTIAPMLIVVQYMKILVCGFLAYKLLGFYGFRGGVRIIGAYLYGFNSFLIIWGQHYWFGAASMYMVLLLIVLEKWLHQMGKARKWMLIYSATVAAIFIYSVYIAYMAILAASMYALIRFMFLTELQGRKLLKEILGNGGRLIGSTLLGLLMASVMILPFIDNNMMISSRISTESIWVRIIENLINPYGWKYYTEMLVRAISSNALGINSLGGGYYGHPLLSISAVGLPFLLEGILSIYSGTKNLRSRRVFWGTLLLIMFVIFVPLGSMILNAFQYAFGRYTFILMPIFLVIIAFGLDRIYTQQKMNYFATGLLITGEIVLLIYSVFTYENNNLIRDYVKFLILINFCMYFSMILCAKFTKRYGAIFVFGIVIMGCMQETYISSSSQERETKANLEIESRKSTENIVDLLQEEHEFFFRIDKTYNDFRWLGDSLIEGLNLPTGYNSTINRNVSQFYEQVWPQVCTDGSTRVTTTRGFISDGRLLEKDNILTLLGIKYIISQEEIVGTGQKYRVIEGSYDGKIVYENTEAVSIVTAFNHAISQTEFERYTQEERNEIIKSHLILSEEEITANEIPTVEVDFNQAQKDGFDNDYSLESIKDTYFKGEITVEEDKFLLIAIPYRQGWEIDVNGNKTELFKGDYGFLACYVPEGTHILEIKYENKMYLAGTLLSLLGIGIWIFLWYNKEVKKL